MELPEVDPETVVKYLTRTELGAAMWRAATAEGLAEALAQRVEQLEARNKKDVGDDG